MSVCLFSIGGHTVGHTVLKFGMEDHIYPREVMGYILLGYPNSLGRGEAKEWFWRSTQPKQCISVKIS